MIFRKLGNLNIDRSLGILSLAVISFSCALYFHQHSKRPEINVSKQDSALNLSSTFLKIFSSGNKRLIADILWIQTLLESDFEHYQGNPLNNWMYVRFKNIADLDPLFYENYLYGGQYLSIIKDDPEAADIIMERGLVHYPNSYSLNFNQAFNAYFELGDYQKGLKHFERIQNDPEAPSYLTSLIIKLKHQVEGDPQVTLALLHESYLKTPDKLLKNKLASDIYSLKATIDLECLNAGKKDCERRDAEGDPYLYRDGVYRAKKEFKPYKIFRQPQ